MVLRKVGRVDIPPAAYKFEQGKNTTFRVYLDVILDEFGTTHDSPPTDLFTQHLLHDFKLIIGRFICGYSNYNKNTVKISIIIDTKESWTPYIFVVLYCLGLFYKEYNFILPSLVTVSPVSIFEALTFVSDEIKFLLRGFFNYGFNIYEKIKKRENEIIMSSWNKDYTLLQHQLSKRKNAIPFGYFDATTILEIKEKCKKEFILRKIREDLFLLRCIEFQPVEIKKRIYSFM